MKARGYNVYLPLFPFFGLYQRLFRLGPVDMLQRPGLGS